MARSMTKSQLLTNVSETTGLSKRQVNDVLDALALEVEEAVKGVQAITIPGVAKISCSLRKARKGRNPQTGESIKIPAKVAVRATAVKSVKDCVPSVEQARRKLR